MRRIPKANSVTARPVRKTRVPDPRLRFDPDALNLSQLPREFYRQDTVPIARSIIGAWFARRYRNHWYGARIVETEAYLGSGDAAAHSWGGRRTPRVEPMYMDGGHVYVFLVYGIHHCANVVTRTVGVAEAVLLRAAEAPGKTPARLMSGPGKLCAALGITAEFSGTDLLSDGDLRLFKAPEDTLDIGISKRIGVDYAGDAAHWPLRFFYKNSPAVSKIKR